MLQSDLVLYVNRLNTEESVIPYEYHHFDFCPIDEKNSPVENLGQVVFGERIRPGPYKIRFLEEVKCQEVCVLPASRKTCFNFRQPPSQIGMCSKVQSWRSR